MMCYYSYTCKNIYSSNVHICTFIIYFNHHFSISYFSDGVYPCFFPFTRYKPLLNLLSLHKTHVHTFTSACLPNGKHKVPYMRVYKCSFHFIRTYTHTNTNNWVCGDYWFIYIYRYTTYTHVSQRYT